jgi:ubiquitin-protein ligase
VEVKVDFTESFHDFNLLVSNAHPRGSTLLYDAMVVATQNLLNLKKKYPNCILRILALTDGEDTGSKSSIVDTSQLLIDHHILVDSFVVGSNCEGLKCISFAAGGKCYLARDIQESLKLFEQETVLSARSRKAEAKIAYENVAELVERMKLRPIDMPNNVHEFKLPDIGKPAIDVKNLAEQLHKDPNKLNHIAPTGSLKRIVKELTNYQANPHPFVSIYPCEDMTLWKILLLGPQKTPYEGGLFQLYAKFPSDYPFKPPEVRFVTPIYHCNMNSQGRICHSVFDRNYSPAITFKTIIDSIYGLILTPEPDDPLDNVVATYFLSNYQQYYENAVKATKANASKGV